jgi:hypothetical protein
MTESNPKPLTPAQRLAVCVLTGDLGAIPALLDATMEETGLSPLPALQRVTCGRDRLRIVLRAYPELGNDVEFNRADMVRNLQRWLDGEAHEPLALQGLTMDLYELPAPGEVDMDGIHEQSPLSDVANPLPDELVRQLNACTGGSQLWKLTYFPDRRLWEISPHFRGDDGRSRCSPAATPRLAAEAALRHYRGQSDPAGT